MTNDKDSAVLLPCPNVLCGSNNILVWQSDMRRKHKAWSVMCRDCGASVGQRYDTEEEAAAAWNTRQPTQSDALREALESIKQRCKTFANINLVGRSMEAKKAGTLRRVYEDACAALQGQSK